MATKDPLFLAASPGMKHCQQSLLYQGLSPCLLEPTEGDGYTQEPSSQLETVSLYHAEIRSCRPPGKVWPDGAGVFQQHLEDFLLPSSISLARGSMGLPRHMAKERQRNHVGILGRWTGQQEQRVLVDRKPGLQPCLHFSPAI